MFLTFYYLLFYDDIVRIIVGKILDIIVYLTCSCSRLIRIHREHLNVY